MLIFLLILTALFIAEAILCEVEYFGAATVTLIVTLVLAHYFHVFSVVQFVSQNGWLTSLYALGYVAIGVAWSFVKWFSFLMNYRDKFREAKAAWLSRNNLNNITTVLTPEQTKDFQSTLRYSLSNKPTALTNKSRIMSWMCLWPFSFVGTLLNDPVRKLFNWLFSNFKALYQKMADHILKDVDVK